MDTWRPPDSFDSYRLVRLLGRGGMGQVHLAHDTLLDRPVAIKFIASPDAEVEAHQRFLVEARAIARLQHPNVVAVHRVGLLDGRPYLVSEYVDGQPLSAVPLPMPWTEVLGLAVKLARALAAAHQRGVIHRDIKPANVMLTSDGEPKLLDFGIAKLQAPSGDRAAPPRAEVWSEPSAPDSTPTHDAWQRGCAPPALDSDVTCEVEVRVQPRLERQLTLAGSALGTLPYMAPEVLQGAHATFAADIYAFGVLLHELCSGKLPRQGPLIASLRAGRPVPDATPLAALVPGIDHRLSDIVLRCLRCDPRQRYQDGNELRIALSQLTPEARGGQLPEGNPYRGLHAFEAEHQDVFFGRDSETRTVLDRLAETPLVVVAGDSGLGKSSLCRAGVLPRVAAWFGGARSWSAITMVPDARPLDSLLRALGDLLPAEQIVLGIRDDPSLLARMLRKRLGSTEGVVLLVDQLEELATVADPAETALAAEVLGWLCEPSPALRVLATVRSDFLARIAALPRLGDLSVRALYFLRPLSEQRVREAIVGPASAKGVTFDPDVVDALVASTVHSTGGLPLLQFALAELWDARQPSSAAIAADLLASIGGVGGALSRHGDSVLSSMTPRVRAAARRVLMRLVTADRTRIRRAEADLAGDPESATAIATLLRMRLLSATEAQGVTHYELAHESLVRGWATLAGWLAATDATAHVVERLAMAAADWERSGRSRHHLWNSEMLADASAARLEAPTSSQRAFLRASRAAQFRNRALRLGALAAIPAIIGATWALWGAQARRDIEARSAALEAQASMRLDTGRAWEAQAARLRARAARAFDASQVDAGEHAWAASGEAQGRSAQEYAAASQLLENALLLDPASRLARDRLSEVLLGRALAAESRHDRAGASDLLQRLALYDADGRWRRGWAQGGTLRIVGHQAGLVLTVSAAGHALAALPGFPVHLDKPLDLDLPIGSYLASLRAEGRAPAVLPFLVSRGAVVEIDAHLPEKSSIPPGYVYVPAGSFRFGSDAEDSLRRSYYRAAPLYESRTGAYLIARHETTFADWISFLEALPVPTRRSHLPHVGSGGFQGALALTQDRNGRWNLRLQPAQVEYKVRQGEDLQYRGRAGNAKMDWSRLPVTGISTDDAEAYVAWLASTGRVPGARLCSEKEWERAARGADGRPWPAGDQLSTDDANIDVTYERSPEGMGPDEVGSHPSGRSPFGLDDMAGNAWEWTRSSLGTGYVARGGSYCYDANAARAANREIPEPGFRDTSVGLRVCADPPPR